MKKIIVLVFLTCILLPLLALDDAIKIKEVDSLTDLSYHYICQVDIENSLKYAKQALDLSEEINYSQEKAESNFYIAQTLFDVGSFHESLDYLMKAEAEEFTKKTPLVQFEVDRIKGRIFSHLLLKEQALKAFRNCLVLSDKLLSSVCSSSYENDTSSNFTSQFFGILASTGSGMDFLFNIASTASRPTEKKPI